MNFKHLMSKEALPFWLALAMLILSSVSLGSVNRISEDSQQKKDAARSSSILVVMTVVLTVYLAWGMKDSMMRQTQYVYYF